MKARDTDPSILEFEEDVSARFKLAVEALGVPKGEIAEAIGVSPQRLSNWTGNHNRPDWFHIARFCRRFGVSADWILLGDVGSLKKGLADSLEPAWEERLAARRAGASPAPRTPSREKA